jgi:beta-carotene 3-hydroxylase
LPEEGAVTVGEIIATVGLSLVVACAMEPWSRFVHGRWWHGPLYGLHRTHHPDATEDRRWWEANDLFSLLHALPAAFALYFGWAVLDGVAAVLATGLGLGLCSYGMAYVVVHDGLVHGRLPVGFLARWRFFRRVRAAHEVHHRQGGVPFGLFLGPRELRRAQTRVRRAGHDAAPSAAPTSLKRPSGPV